MANIKITELPIYEGDIKDIDIIPIVEVQGDNGVTRKVGVGTLRANFAPNITLKVICEDDGNGSPRATVEKKGTKTDPLYILKFYNLKGQKGDKGDPGDVNNHVHSKANLLSWLGVESEDWHKLQIFAHSALERSTSGMGASEGGFFYYVKETNPGGQSFNKFRYY